MFEQLRDSTQALVNFFASFSALLYEVLERIFLNLVCFALKLGMIRTF